MTDEIAEVEQRGEYTREDLLKIGAKWMERIQDAEEREEAWIKDAQAAEKAYLVDRTTDTEGDVPEFNILHSNVETIVPSIYNSTPTPDIRPRHNSKDQLGKLVADILERSISTLIDDDRLDGEIEKEAQDAFMAGRGIVRVKFDADVIDKIDPMTGLPYQDVTNERVLYEVVSWRDYREGPATKWRNVPWVAFRHWINHEALEKLEDEELAELQADPEASEDKDRDVALWEIWCKESGRVYFVVADSTKVVRIEDDPLGLSGFFPMAEPVQPICGTGKRTPVCPYSVYKVLADELDRQTRRINAILKGLKLRGAIAADAEAIELISKADDNELVAVPNIENLAAVGGLEKAIMWWPIDRAIQVLRELYAQREQTKQTIYEVTGISDIVRGASKSSETATAQGIKEKWGSLRIKKMQRLIERNVRDLFVITAEIIARHFTAATLQKMSGIQIPPEAGQILSQPLDHYRIDVESDSTVRADTTRSRTEMAEFLNGTAQFFSTMAPIAQQAPGSIGPLVEMYSSFARQFNLGKQAEDALDQLSQMAEQVAKQPPPDPEAEAKKEEAQLKRDKLVADVEGAQEERKLKLFGMQLENRNKQADLILKRENLQLEESRAEFDAIKSVVEMDMEADQERAVKIGDQ